MLGAWTERQEPQDSAAVTEPSVAWGQPRGADPWQGLLYLHTQESPEESLSPAHFLQLYPDGQDWATATAGCLPADGNTQLIRKMGGSWWGRFGFNGLAFTPSSLLGRLSSTKRGFYRKGLNRRLPRQTKPAPGLALEMEAKAGRGRRTVSLKSWLQ